MPDIGAKFRALLLSRIWTLGHKQSSLTAALMRHWNLTEPLPNPPLAHRFSTKIAYFRQYNIEMAYIAPPRADESTKEFKLRLNGTLRNMSSAMEGTTKMRITRKYPETRWERVWKNLHAAVAPEFVRLTWYLAIHDVIPTKERLVTTGLTDTSSCARCGKHDSLEHRIVACGEGPVIWHWTRKRFATILRKGSEQVPVDWILRPDFQLWPPQRQAAVLWILAHLTGYRLQDSKRLSLLDYMNFMRRARWKLYNGTFRRLKVGR
jgi:hypothetical protein